MVDCNGQVDINVNDSRHVKRGKGFDELMEVVTAIAPIIAHHPW